MPTTYVFAHFLYPIRAAGRACAAESNSSVSSLPNSTMSAGASSSASMSHVSPREQHAAEEVLGVRELRAGNRTVKLTEPHLPQIRHQRGRVLLPITSACSTPLSMSTWWTSWHGSYGGEYCMKRDSLGAPLHRCPGLPTSAKAASLAAISHVAPASGRPSTHPHGAAAASADGPQACAHETQ